MNGNDFESWTEKDMNQYVEVPPEHEGCTSKKHGKVGPPRGKFGSPPPSKKINDFLVIQISPSESNKKVSK